LNTKDLNIEERVKNENSSHNSPHRNPNEYNGETIDNQLVKSKKSSNKKVLIEVYDCK
jgi:hypothetical protein